MEQTEANKTLPLTETPETAKTEPIKKSGIWNRLNFLKFLRKQQIDKPLDNANEIEERRRALASIEMARNTGHQVSDDRRAEEENLDAIVALGGKLTDQELHRKAINVADRERPKGQQLTEAMVTQVEARLRSEQPAKSPTPIPFARETQPATTPEAPQTSQPEEKAA